MEKMNKKSNVNKFAATFHQHDDETPPILEPESSAGEEPASTYERHRTTLHASVQSNQRTCPLEETNSAYGLDDGYYVDNGVLYQKNISEPSRKRFAVSKPAATHYSSDGSASFGTTNICCGLCGEIVVYNQLVTEHLPAFHPEVLSDGVVDLEEIPYETWLNERIRNEQQQPFSHSARMHLQQQILQPVRSTRQLRRISQYRVNTAEMGIPELELALQKKMVEKMGRKVPVTLVDKLHAKCGLCDTVISLNKKFEIVHLVRHFNAWHPSSHKCAGTWPNRELPTMMGGKPLSSQDFAVIDPDIGAIENLQCIWCGMFLSNKALGMHFHEVHPEEVEVPKCNLCMQEVLINARLTEKFGEDFGVTLPDEHFYRSIRFKRDFRTETALEKAIVKYLYRVGEGADPLLVDIEDMDTVSDEEDERNQGLASCEEFANSRMNCGRRAKPKRQFIMPVVRQAAPKNSQFVTAITHSHWKCKLCNGDIYAAVISAGVIKHYKKFHPNYLPDVQYEICKARLEKVSDGKMDFVENDVVECRICHQNFPVTPPFNICRAIRHIKMKHPEVMPEHRGGESTRDGFPSQQTEEQTAGTSNGAVLNNSDMEEGVIYATEVIDFSILDMLRQNYNSGFDRVFSVYGREIQQEIYILTNEGDELDAETVEQISKVKDPMQNPMVVQINKSLKTDSSAF